ncbi:MAG: tetratricopeptide repeat protein [Gemmatimonadetes bacterium]|nr:tetratricopeptide repeat protein [Gemmatimonadota bacterium]
MEERKPLRKFSDSPQGAGVARSTDATDRTGLLWSVIAGALGMVMGGLLGVFLVATGAPAWVGALSPFAMAALTVGIVRAVVGGGARVAGTIYNPTGSATPRRKEYSGAESLAAQGRLEDAITAFELAVAEDPGDPWPYLRVARIYRDQLGRFEDAARWFRRALREATACPVLARRELVELYVHRMKEPGKAAPLLARMADELVGTPEGEWAAEELREVKARLRAELEA